MSSPYRWRGYAHSLAHCCCNGINIALTCILVGVQLWRRVCVVVWNAEAVRYGRCMIYDILHEKFGNLFANQYYMKCIFCDSVIPEVWNWILWYIMICNLLKLWSMCFVLYMVVQSNCLHWLTLWRGECTSFFLNYRLFVWACLCPIGDWYFGLYTVYPLVVGSHRVRHMVNKLWAHEDMLFHKRGVCDTHENSGISCGISYMSYIGQCDLINTCFRLPWVWYTLGGSMCRICHLTSKESIFTLIGSYWPTLSNWGLISSHWPN